VSKVWKAIGDFVILAKDDAKSNSGIILDTDYIIVGVGGFVPVDIECGDGVALIANAEPTLLEPSNPNSPIAVHYSNICSISINNSMEVGYVLEA
tara:strand:+ start:78 stop:362 length:285 start_codon:yes stop_codon:yes gene_type:complete